MSEAICGNCGARNDSAQRFCGSCGQALTLSCGACGATNPPGFRFCGTCGASLEAGAAPARIAPEEGERRHATVLFADLSGFTALSERLDPEDVTALVDRCSSLMGDIVERYGGVVSRIIGDELMGLFGAPLSHEDDPERAVRTALELQQCALDHTEEFGGMSLRVGVNTGEMLSGPVGPNREHTVMGDAVNVAKRLQTAAPLGGVVVGEETYRASRHAIRYEELTPIEAKGKTDPVRAWRAIEAEAPSPRPVSAAPLVGRASELDLLRGVWSRVESERRPHLVTVIAPPGLGKTRISGELTGPLETLGVTVLRGRCLPYGESTGWGAFAQQLRQFAGILDTDPAPEALAKLRGAASSLLGPASQEIARGLASLAGLATEDAPAERGALFLAARQFVEALAQERPTILMFEDIHWADNSLLDLIEYLAGRTREAPALLLSLARPELLDRRPNWGGGLASYTAMHLEPLALNDSAELIRHLLPSAADATILERLVETGGGNPLFLEELAATFSEQTTGIARELPTSVTGIIAARLDTLPPLERRVLLDASVVGKVFWHGALAQMIGDAKLDEALDALEAKDLVRRVPASQLTGEAEYIFKHMLIREVAYQTLPRAARRVRHDSVARYIEKAAGDRIAGSASLLAYHWREAGDAERAIDYLLQAAGHAAGSWAKEEAISLYTEALDLAVEDDHARRHEILLRRGMERVALSDFEGAVADLDMVLDHLEGRDLVSGLIARARASFWLFRTDEGKRFAQRAVEESERHGFDDLVPPALGWVSINLASEPEHLHEAIGIGQKSLDLWKPGVHVAHQATIMTLVGQMNYWSGDIGTALDLCGPAYQLAVDVQAFEGVLNGGANLGLALTLAGRHEEAVVLFENVITQGRDFGTAARWLARATNMFAGALLELLAVDEARQRNEEAIELARSVGFAVAELQGEIDLVNADLLEHEAGAARTRIDRLTDIVAKAKGFHEWLVRTRLDTLEAELALAEGSPDEAVDRATHALNYAVRVGRPKYQIFDRLVLARALTELKNYEDAAREARSAFEGAQRLGNPPSIWRTALVFGELLLTMARDDEAASVFATARSTVQSFAATLSDARRERFLASPQVQDMLSRGR